MDAHRSHPRPVPPVSRAARAWILPAVAALLLAGCAPAVPRVTLVEPSAGPSSAAAPRLATALRAAVDPAAILADLDRLAAITEDYGGTRAAGNLGYLLASEWIAGELRDAGYEVTIDPVSVPAFSQNGRGVLEILAAGAPALEGPRDFKAMLLLPPGDVTGPLYALGFDTAAGPEARNGIGCSSSAWSGVPRGAIVLVQPGPCLARTIVEHAQAAGAAALISANPAWGPGQVRRPTLVDPSGLAIPAVAATRDAGLALAEAAQFGARVHLRISTTVETWRSDNVIAQTPGGNASRVLMLGAHLDSSIDGPGINDNGTGVPVLLEVARQLAALTHGQPAWKVRVAFWTGEESGLWGSVDYASALTDSERASIAAYLNLDMLATPGGTRQVYDAATFANPASAAIERLFSHAFDVEGLSWEPVAIGGASDHYLFDQLGIPVGGIIAEAKAGDACYHLACDTVGNVDAELLGQMARAAAWATGALAGGRANLGP